MTADQPTSGGACANCGRGVTRIGQTLVHTEGPQAGKNLCGGTYGDKVPCRCKDGLAAYCPRHGRSGESGWS